MYYIYILKAPGRRPSGQDVVRTDLIIYYNLWFIMSTLFYNSLSIL